MVLALLQGLHAGRAVRRHAVPDPLGLGRLGRSPARSRALHALRTQGHRPAMAWLAQQQGWHEHLADPPHADSRGDNSKTTALIYTKAAM